MSLKVQALRAGNYLRKHGLGSSLGRVRREIRNRLFFNRLVVHCRDLHSGGLEGRPLPENCRVERFRSRAEIPERLYRKMTGHFSEEMLQSYMQKRFDHGGCLWCLRNDAEDICYTWTVTGRAMKAFCLPPMLERDVYCMDSFVFPPHQGRGMNSVLKDHILRQYSSEGYCRAFSETWEWNTSAMKSLAKNGFVKVGFVRKRSRRGRCRLTWWY